MKKLNLFIVGISVFIFMILLLSFFKDTESLEYKEEISKENKLNYTWKSLTLKDIRTGEEYSVSSLSDRPILIESFAVWCPSCTRQQAEVEKLKNSYFNESFYSISLSTDSNEDEEKVLDHITKNKFSGTYSISSKDFTNSLIEEFGLGVVNAPSMPMILVCQDSQQTHYLKSGLKTADELKESIENLCLIN